MTKRKLAINALTQIAEIVLHPLTSVINAIQDSDNHPLVCVQFVQTQIVELARPHQLPAKNAKIHCHFYYSKDNAKNEVTALCQSVQML